MPLQLVPFGRVRGVPFGGRRELILTFGEGGIGWHRVQTGVLILFSSLGKAGGSNHHDWRFYQ
jgi:hypothetical protein